jgi:DNA-binding beta-propeller fold protein YncE
LSPSASAFVKRGDVVSTHYTTVSMIRTIVDVLGIESPGLNDALAEPMADIFNPYPRSWSYTAVVPPVLRSTQLPLPPASMAASVTPLRTADYWHRAMDGQNFEREDDLDTDAFNEALWQGLRGDEPYPVVRHGKDLRRNRAALLKEHDANRLKNDARATDVSSR